MATRQVVGERDPRPGAAAMKEARPTDDIKVLERCSRLRLPSWWAFWRGPESDHKWGPMSFSDTMRFQEVCKYCGLRRKLLWAFPETWEYDARFKVSGGLGQVTTEEQAPVRMTVTDITDRERLEEAAYRAANELENVPTHGPGNPWSEEILHALEKLPRRIDASVVVPTPSSGTPGLAAPQPAGEAEERCRHLWSLDSDVCLKCGVANPFLDTSSGTPGLAAPQPVADREESVLPELDVDEARERVIAWAGSWDEDEVPDIQLRADLAAFESAIRNLVVRQLGAVTAERDELVEQAYRHAEGWKSQYNAEFDARKEAERQRDEALAALRWIANASTDFSGADLQDAAKRALTPPASTAAEEPTE